MLNIILEDTPKMLHQIKESILRENWEETYNLSHKLKSSIGLLQMHNMLESLALIEQFSKTRDHLDELPALIDSAIEEYHLVQPMLEAERDTAKS